MRIGIIGAGRVGTTLGKGLEAAGHEVVYGVRELAKEPPYPGAATKVVREAVADSEVVILATPWNGAEEAIESAGDFGGKPLIDVTNPIGPGFTLTLGHTTSGGELLAALAKNAHVVKAFNTTGLENMASPSYGARRVVMPLASDDKNALAIAAQLATDLGFEAVPLSPLSRARLLEPFGLLWIKLALQLGHGRSIAFGISRRTPDDKPSETKRSGAPKTITIVGTGNIGGALARGWLRAGHAVRLATRDPNAKEVAALVALGGKAVPITSAAKGADVVVLAVPAGAVSEIVAVVGPLEGVIVVDCTNAIGKGFSLQFGHTSSSSEEIAKTLPGAKLVRAFNQQGAETLQNAVFGGVAATTFVAADDAEARATVAALARDLGLDAVEAGALSSSRELEPVTLLWIAIAQAIGTREFGLSLLRR